MKHINIRQGLIFLFLITTLCLGGCSTTQSGASSTDGGVAPNISSNVDTSNLPRLEGMATVVMQVNGSAITIEVDGTKAPITAGNFVELVNKGVYDDIAFHRVVREPQPFVVQGGDPQSKNAQVPMSQLGTGGYSDPTNGQERYIPLEIQPENATEPVYSQTFDAQGIRAQPTLQHTRGAVAMARSRLPDSASSQFYFALADLPFLDGNYAVFGYVTDGMDVIDRIQPGDRIESAKVTEGLENLKN
ncbi:MAG: peptidylprolyl isomerase [Microcoleaceae cyanobacterium]